jgi:hypothetical protein
MSVYKKLMAARVKLQATELKKSGNNKFAGYNYFELGDFLPAIQQIFNEIGLCGIVSYDIEYARLCITDVEDGSAITITSPMAEAQLKGNHPIQNLGAVETYQRRYLWMTALEIVEHDAIDSSPQEAKAAPEPPVASPPAAKPPKKVEGKEGKWQITVTSQEGVDPDEWLKLVEEASDICLSMAQSEEDVMQIFRKNKQLFDSVKATNATFFKDLMDKFGAVRKQFKEQ